MELNIQHIGSDRFTVQDQHGCYLDRDGDQVSGVAVLNGDEVLAVVKHHVEAQTA